MTNTAQHRIPQPFNIALSDHMDETKEDTARVLIENEKAKVRKKY